MYVFLGHFNPHTIFSSFYSKINLNIIFPFTPVSHTLLRLQVIQPQYFLRVSNSIPQCVLHVRLSIIFQMITPNNTACAAPYSVIISIPTFPTARCTLALSHSVTVLVDFRPVQNDWQILRSIVFKQPICFLRNVSDDTQ